MNDDIKCIADHYGLSAQTGKTIEELAKLIQVLARNDFSENDRNMSRFVEELQMKYLLSIPEAELKSIKSYKIMRTIAAIGGTSDWKD